MLKKFYPLIACVGVPFGFVYAQESKEAGFSGNWMLELAVPPADVAGLLTLQHLGSEWVGHVEGGPVVVNVGGDQIELIIDSRDIAGFIFERRLLGRLTGNVMSGTLSIIGQPDSGESGSFWTARRASENEEIIGEPRFADLSGTWIPAAGMDFRKYSMDLTPEAKIWHQDYLLHLDQPNVRCVSPGIVAMIAWSAYPSEWLINEGRITIIYEVGSEVRRVYLDGREPPEYFPHSPMGFSTGYWEGGTFVIETTLLSRNVRDFLGEPVSENAKFVERYQLNEDGTILTAVMTLHDPENYLRPPIRRRQWHRDADAVLFPYECDPDSFFRQLYDEGKMQEYIDRADRRL